MIDIIDKLLSAEEGNPVLGEKVLVAAGWYDPGAPAQWGAVPISVHVTTSIDAAKALADRLFPGWIWQIDLAPGGATVQGAPEHWSEGLVASDRGLGVLESAPTAPLAFCAAILRAKEQGLG